MPEGEARVFRRNTAAFVISGFLLGFFLLMFAMGIWLEYLAAILVAFAAALWQVVFIVWVDMYPYARLDGERVTIYARFQQRRAIALGEITGLERRENDVELSLESGEVVSLSLFWMNPADREPFVAALQPPASCRCEERGDEANSE